VEDGIGNGRNEQWGTGNTSAQSEGIARIIKKGRRGGKKTFKKQSRGGGREYAIGGVWERH